MISLYSIRLILDAKIKCAEAIGAINRACGSIIDTIGSSCMGLDGPGSGRCLRLKLSYKSASGVIMRAI